MNPSTRPRKPVRRSLIVDPKVQFTIVAAMLFLAAIGFVLGCVAQTAMDLPPGGVEGPVESHFGPLFFGALASISFAVFLGLILTNQICGPVFRLRRELKNLADGKPATPIRLRKGDQFQSLIDEFNRMIEMNTRESSSSTPSESLERERQAS